MNEMIEKVARTLEKQAWAALGCGDTLAYQNRRISSLRKARAAIEAMMTPTIEMGLAGFDQLSLEASPLAAEACYQAMLMEALKER